MIAYIIKRQIREGSTKTNAAYKEYLTNDVCIRVIRVLFANGSCNEITYNPYKETFNLAIQRALGTGTTSSHS